MTTKNDITGDAIKTKGFSKAFEDNFDRIFRNKKPEPPAVCDVCGKELNKVSECAWTSCPKWLAEWNEERIDRVGQNGNEGLHYNTKEQS